MRNALLSTVAIYADYNMVTRFWGCLFQYEDEAGLRLSNSSSSSSSAFLSLQEQKLLREELQARVELLSGMNSKCALAGPVCDCVVFNDGQSWRWEPEGQSIVGVGRGRGEREREERKERG